MSTIDKFLQEVLDIRSETRFLRDRNARLVKSIRSIADEARKNPETGHIAVMAIRALEEYSEHYPSQEE